MRIKIAAVDESIMRGPGKLYTPEMAVRHTTIVHQSTLGSTQLTDNALLSFPVRHSSQQQILSKCRQPQEFRRKVMATMILTDPTSLVTPKDIFNAKSAMGSKQLATGTSIEVLLKKLKENNFYHAFEVDPTTSRLLYLMWAHQDITALARHFMDLMLLDCTYKTNRHRLPLLNAVILTGMNTLLPLARLWFPGEAEHDFTWALSKLRELLDVNSIPVPRVTLTDRDLGAPTRQKNSPRLRSWHIRRNVLAQAQKRICQTPVQNSDVCRKKTKNSIDTDMFMAKFDETINSATESEFMESSGQLAQRSSSIGEYLVECGGRIKTSSPGAGQMRSRTSGAMTRLESKVPTPK